MTDNELLSGFEDCTLANEAFHHEEHVRVAFLYLSRYPVLQALERFSRAIRRFAEAHGKATLYNEKYYQPETLQSELAKQTFLLPDRIEERPR